MFYVAFKSIEADAFPNQSKDSDWALCTGIFMFNATKVEKRVKEKRSRRSSQVEEVAW